MGRFNTSEEMVILTTEDRHETRNIMFSIILFKLYEKRIYIYNRQMDSWQMDIFNTSEEMVSEFMA